MHIVCIVRSKQLSFKPLVCLDLILECYVEPNSHRSVTVKWMKVPTVWRYTTQEMTQHSWTHGGTYPRSNRAQRWHLVRKMTEHSWTHGGTYPRSDRAQRWHLVWKMKVPTVWRYTTQEMTEHSWTHGDTYPRSDRAQRWHLARKMKAPAHVREVTYPSDRVDFHGVPVLQLRQVLRSGWFLSMSKQKRNSVMINE